MEPYTIDASKISLDQFQKLTLTKRLLPGRVILQEKMSERFTLLKDAGISNLGQLIRILGSKAKITRFALQHRIPSEYLVILKREAGSYLARPFKLSEFPGIPFEFTEALKSKGIRNTKEFFEWVQVENQREELAGKTGIPSHRLLELFALCDLSRITGVGGTFACVIYESGIRSTEEFANLTTADFSTEEDLRYCVGYAKIIVECGRKEIQL